MYTNMENNKLTLGIFIDYSKAFDYLNHEILLNKLQDYAIHGVANALVRSYLSNRQQRVAIGDLYSFYKNVSCSVLQGRILGPLLFNSYVNDIVNIPCDATFLLYADDTSLFASSSNIEEIITKAQKALTEVFEWSNTNGLKINAVKIKAVLFKAKNAAAKVESILILG